MNEQTEKRLEKLKSLRTELGEPVVLEGENPVQKLKDAIYMAERAGLLYRYAMDGREFQYRISEPAPVLQCKMVEAPLVLCAIVEENLQPLEKEEVWEPTPEYAKALAEEPEPEEKPKPKPKSTRKKSKPASKEPNSPE
jgi:hypothetical protein